MRGPFIGVIGAGSCPAEVAALAAEVGREIAKSGAVLVCGGLGGVMAAAARGAKEMKGFTVGILPGAATADANPYIDFPVATNIGQARNAVIVQTADVLIAVSGSYGTLSEMAMALRLGKGVVALLPSFSVSGVRVVGSPEEAVREALSLIGAAHASPRDDAVV